jgi:hypothetical protein
MAGKSDYLENKILDHVLRNVAYTQPATVYVGLYTAAPTDAGGGTEVAGNAYARKAAAFGAAAGGVASNTGVITFDTPTPSGWGTVSHIGIFDAVSAGNLLYWAPLAVARTVLAGEPPFFAIGSITVSED